MIYIDVPWVGSIAVADLEHIGLKLHVAERDGEVRLVVRGRAAQRLTQRGKAQRVGSDGVPHL